MTKFIIFIVVLAGVFFTWIGMTGKTSLYTSCMKNYNNDAKCTCFSSKVVDTLGGVTLMGFNSLILSDLAKDTYSASLKACNLSETDLILESLKSEIKNKLFN